MKKVLFRGGKDMKFEEFFEEFTEQIILLKDNTAVVVYSQWGNSGYIKQYFQGFLKYIGTIYKVYQR